MKKFISFISLIFVLSVFLSSCESSAIEMIPSTSQMQAICEMGTMECYYHTVAIVEEDDARKFLWWSKDKHFWIEYSAKATLGVDISLLEMDISGDKITIKLPEAKIITTGVDGQTKFIYYVDADSVKINSEDETKAMAIAQADLETKITSDKALLSSARERAKTLLENYINKIENITGREYEIEWIYLDSDANA